MKRKERLRKRMCCLRNVFAECVTLAVSLFLALSSPATYAYNVTGHASYPAQIDMSTLAPDLFSGAFEYSVPIEVPKGRNGIAPHLALKYSSGSGDGWLGIGWHLDVGSIERNARKGVNFSGTDFVMNLGGTRVDLVYDSANQMYVEKVRNAFYKIKFESSAYWVATDKKGTQYFFGETAQSRQASGSNVFGWHLDKVLDTNGNYMTLSYTLETGGQLHLNTISYTGNGAVAPTYTITFYSESRTDTPVSYRYGLGVVTAKRLKTIAIRSAAGSMIRAYQLTYEQGGTTSRSRLTSIQQFGKDASLSGSAVTSGTSLPAITLGWRASGSAPASVISAPPIYGLISYNGSNAPQGVGDFNGDGYGDIVFRVWVENQSYQYIEGAIICKGTSGGTFQCPALNSQYYYPLTDYSNLVFDFWPSRFGDLNGDGRTDMMNYNMTAQTWKVCTFGANGYPVLSDGTTPGCVDNIVATYYANKLGDFNGDGRTDMLFADGLVSNSESKICYSNYSSWTPSFACNTSADLKALWSDPYLVGDVDGDGISDLIDPSRGMVYYINADRTITSASIGSLSGTAIGGDFNGDGLADVAANYNSTNQSWSFCLSGGVRGSFQCSTRVTSGIDAGTIKTGDFNGDGRTDLASQTSGQDWNYCLAVANGAFSCGPFKAPSDATAVKAGDYTGDGRTDFWSYNGIINFHFNPDQLTEVTNGLGGHAAISYSTTTDPAVVTGSASSLPYPVPVVKSITTCDNWSGGACASGWNSAVKEFKYSGGYYYIPTREFRGFNKGVVTKNAGSTDPTQKTVTTTWFHQGADTAVDVNNPAVANAYTSGKAYKVQVEDGNTTPKLESLMTTVYEPDSDGVAPYFTPEKTIVSKMYKGDGSTTATLTVQEDKTYDTYGNLTVDAKSGDTLTTADDRTVTRTYTNDVADYIVGLPLSEKVDQGVAPAALTMKAKKLYYYDGIPTVTSCSSFTTLPSAQVPSSLKGNLTRVDVWVAGSTFVSTGQAYDDYGNIECRRDGKGNISSITYEPTFMFPVSETNPLAQVVATEYYGINGVPLNDGETNGLYGQIKSLTDRNGIVALHTYDNLGRKSSDLVKPSASSATILKKTTFGYPSTYGVVSGTGTTGQHNTTVSYSDVANNVSRWSEDYFDGFGRIIWHREQGAASRPNVLSKVQYNPRGEIATQSLPYFEGSAVQNKTYIYDALGRITSITNPDSTVTEMCYDGPVTATVDANGHKRRRVQSAFDKLIEVDEYVGTYSSCDTAKGVLTIPATSLYATTLYQYDALNNLTQIVDAKNNVTTITYDGLSRKTTMLDPDMGTWSYEYDNNGNVWKQTDSKGQITYFQYDALNRMRQKDYDFSHTDAGPKALGSGDIVFYYDDYSALGQ